MLTAVTVSVFTKGPLIEVPDASVDVMQGVLLHEPRPGDAETVAPVLDIGLTPLQPFRVDVREKQLFVRGQGDARGGTVPLA